MQAVDYKELYENVYNPSWKGWKNFFETVKYVEDSGSPSYAWPNNPLMHGLLFLNGYLLEVAVKDYLHLDFNANDHEQLLPRAGIANVPDFKDALGNTYELKCRRNLEDAFKIRNWNDADVRLFYCSSNNVLYQFFPDGSFLRLKDNFRAPYINQRKYPYTAEDLLK